MQLFRFYILICFFATYVAVSPAYSKEEELPQDPDYIPTERLLVNYKSIMFGDDDLDRLYDAMKYVPEPVKEPVITAPVIEGNPTERDNKREEPRVEEEIIITEQQIPTFYLSSILYFGPSNWTFWLNGQKIGNTSAFENLFVKKISGQFIELLLHSPLREINLRWKNYVVPIEEHNATTEGFDYISRDQKILVDSLNDRIKFTLEPHQSLVLLDFSIAEGFVEPVLVEYDEEETFISSASTIADKVRTRIGSRRDRDSDRRQRNALENAKNNAEKENESLISSIFSKFVKKRELINPEDY